MNLKKVFNILLLEKGKKRGRKDDDDDDNKKEDKPILLPASFHKLVKDQTKELWKVREILKDLGKSECMEICDLNNISVKTYNDDTISNIADNIVFGLPTPCPICDGSVQLSGDGYKCSSWSNEWSKCVYHTVCPSREKIKFPKDFGGKDLSKYRGKTFKVTSRIFPIKLPDEIRIVNNPSIYFFNTPSANIKKTIKELGGTIIDENKITSATFIISTSNPSKEEIERIQEILQINIPVLDKEYIDKCIKEKKFIDPQPYLLFYEAKEKEEPKAKKIKKDDDGSNVLFI